jgi:hypothetical protein
MSLKDRASWLIYGSVDCFEDPKKMERMSSDPTILMLLTTSNKLYLSFNIRD